MVLLVLKKYAKKLDKIIRGSPNLHQLIGKTNLSVLANFSRPTPIGTNNKRIEGVNNLIFLNPSAKTIAALKNRNGKNGILYQP